MKKILISTIMLMLILTACVNNKAVVYKDGIYESSGEKWKYGHEKAVVLIKNGKIEDVQLMRFDKNNKEIDYSTWTGEKVNGVVFPNLLEYKETMASKIIEKQSINIDSISGATLTTDNWKKAVGRALKEAQE